MNRPPVILSFGGGVNSTALLVGLHERGYVPDLVLFADTGAEKPETYRHVVAVKEWLLDRGGPEILYVQNDGSHGTLEKECLTKKTLPSLAFGWRKCSEKYKHRPMHKYLRHWPRALETWKAGNKVIRLIGYDAEEEHRRVGGSIKEDRWYAYRHPLIDWVWGREDCKEAIRRADLEVPTKSSCYFCPASTKKEIRRLAQQHPNLVKRALAMEELAMPSLRTSKGLGRQWSWASFLSAENAQPGLFPDSTTTPCMCFDGAGRESDESE
jgi:hypothetical protein